MDQRPAPSPIDALTKFASAHHGLFRGTDATALGWSTRALERLVLRGWCDIPRRGVYRIAGAPRTAKQALLAGVWFSGDDAVGSHRAAGRAWSIPGYRNAGPEVLKPRGQSQRRSYGLVHGCLVLPASHCTIRDNIPVTTPARTIFDLAGVQSPARTERALDHVLNAKLCSLVDVQQVFFALARRGRRGTVTMRELLEARGEGYVPPASELERKARQVFRDAGLPAPTFEVDLGSTDWIGRVDCLWRDAKVIVELDGRRYHDGRLALEGDRRRDNALMAAGWRVIRVTWDDLRDRPTEVVAWVRSALSPNPANLL